jgi:hydroxymethylbilane synthase
VNPLRIGTRGSPLALWQANHVAQRLAQLHGIETQLVRIRTAGDHLQSAAVAQPMASADGKGIFIKELEDALLAGTVDLAVHSMKDVPTEIPPGLAFPAILQREDVRDCLISRDGCRLDELPRGARIGTGSLRRQAQLLHHRPDLQMIPVRGNVDTRLRKLVSGEFDAILLAMAGLNRLGVADKITQVLDADFMLPAVGQGAIGIETRADDAQTFQRVAALDNAETRACITAERALMQELQGGCQVPLGAWARLVQHSLGGRSFSSDTRPDRETGASAPEGTRADGVTSSELLIQAAVFSPDGAESCRREDRSSRENAQLLGHRLGLSLIAAGADKLLRLAGRSVGLD